MDENQVQDNTVAEPQLNDENNEALTNQPEGEEQAEVQSETVAESVETTVEEVEEAEEDDSYQPLDYSSGQSQNQVKPFDFSLIPVDQDGNYDPLAFQQAINDQLAAARQEAQAARSLVLEIEEKRREDQLWHKAMDKYPELKSDKQLAQEVQALRMGMLMQEVSSNNPNAKLISPSQAYERLNKRFASAKQSGIQQATRNVTVQESAYVEPSNSTAGSSKGANRDELFRKMRSSNRAEADAAANAILDNILFGDS